MAVSDYSTTPASNTTISGIDISEGCAPSGINNAIRQMMADIKSALDAAPLLVPAQAIQPSPQSGCAYLANNNQAATAPTLWYLAFDPSTQEHAQLTVPTPSTWEASTIEVRVVWGPAGTGAGNVIWAVRAVGASDGDAPSTWGTAATVTDAAGSTAGAMQRTSAISVTPGGALAASDLLHIQVYRDADDASDTATDDAWLFALEVVFNP